MFTFFCRCFRNFCCCFDIYLAAVFFWFFFCFFFLLMLCRSWIFLEHFLTSRRSCQPRTIDQKGEWLHLRESAVQDGTLTLVWSSHIKKLVFESGDIFVQASSWHCGRAIATDLLLYNFAWNCWPGWWNFNLYIDMSGENCRAAQFGPVHWPCV